MIPYLHKKAIELLFDLIENTNKIKIIKENETLVIFEDNFFLINKKDLSFEYYKYDPSISVYIPRYNLDYFLTDSNKNIDKFKKEYTK